MFGKSKGMCTVFHILSVVHRQTKTVNQKQGQSEIGKTVANSF